MKSILTLSTSILLVGLPASACADNRVVAYPAPQGAALNDDFTVEVCPAGSNRWQTLPSYLVKVDEVRQTKHNEMPSSMAYFDFDGTVNVRVRYNKGDIASARVRPLSYGITPTVEGNTLAFTLDRPRNLSVEVNGDIFHNLHLFANPIEASRPKSDDPNVIYLAPGIHRPDGGRLVVPSGKTLYVAGGAIVMGQIIVRDAHDVQILGRGMVDHTIKMGISISNSQRVLVEGLFCTQCATGGSDSVTIRNVKSISYFGWGDGMNVFASNNVLFDGVFCRNSDDCTTVYGTRKGYVGGCNNITMRNSTLWADVAHPILIGTHGNTPNPETLQNLSYINLDILDHREMQLDYQGCMSLNAGDSNLITGVLFQDIRVEDFRQGQLVNLRVFFNAKYCTSPGRGIDGVLFKNITYTGTHSEISIIAGYDEQRKVKNVTFDNLVINGTHITDSMPGKPAWYKTGDMARIFVGEHTEGIVFK
jgi:hypothetical protein